MMSSSFIFIFLIFCSLSIYSKAQEPKVHKCQSFMANTLTQFIELSKRLKLKNSKQFKNLKSEVHRLNSRLRESRPRFHNKNAYEQWLVEQQRMGVSIEAPYGYSIIWEPQHIDFKIQRIPKIRPRIVPIWIEQSKILTNDSKTWQQYSNWAESYYEKSRALPPGYLKQVKQLQSSFVYIGSKYNQFTEDRHLSDVADSIGKIGDQPRLLSLINGLTGDDLWLDGGTGLGFILEDVLLAMHKTGRSMKDMPHTLGIGYKPEGSVRQHSSQLPVNLSKKHRIWNDRLFEQIPSYELTNLKAKLITDFIGIYSYSSDPAEVINRYLSIMDKEGTLVIVYNINMNFVRVEGQDVPFHEWLTMIAPALSVEHGKSVITNASIADSKDKEREVGYMVIRNPSGQPVILPKLAPSLKIQKINGQWSSTQIFRTFADIIAY